MLLESMLKMYLLDDILESEILPLVRALEAKENVFINRFRLMKIWNGRGVSPEQICASCSEGVLTTLPYLKKRLKEKGLWEESI